MNLRIDTVVTGRRRTAIQLFHLRMYDLAKREFSCADTAGILAARSATPSASTSSRLHQVEVREPSDPAALHDECDQDPPVAGPSSAAQLGASKRRPAQYRSLVLGWRRRVLRQRFEVVPGRPRRQVQQPPAVAHQHDQARVRNYARVDVRRRGRRQEQQALASSSGGATICLQAHHRQTAGLGFLPSHPTAMRARRSRTLSRRPGHLPRSSPMRMPAVGFRHVLCGSLMRLSLTP